MAALLALVRLAVFVLVINVVPKGRSEAGIPRRAAHAALMRARKAIAGKMGGRTFGVQSLRNQGLSLTQKAGGGAWVRGA